MTTPPVTHLRLPGYRQPQSIPLISYLEGSGNYTIVHVQGDLKPLLVSQTLKWFEPNLPCFIRISKSVMVNPDYIKQVVQIDTKVMFLTLSNDLRLRVSRRRILDTLNRLDRS